MMVETFCSSCKNRACKIWPNWKAYRNTEEKSMNTWYNYKGNRISENGWGQYISLSTISTGPTCLYTRPCPAQFCTGNFSAAFQPHLTACFVLSKNKEECKNRKGTQFVQLPCFLLSSAYEGMNRTVRTIISVSFLRLQNLLSVQLIFQKQASWTFSQHRSHLSSAIFTKILLLNREITTHTEAPFKWVVIFFLILKIT